MSIVNESTKAPKGQRVTYGIDITVGKTTFNEWGLHESEAKVVSELLTLNKDQPITTSDGIVYSRRPLSQKQAEFAELKAKLLASNG
jgi:hypothetical protein